MDAARTRRLLGAWLERVLLSLCASILVLLACEVGTRCLTPLGPALLVMDPQVGKRWLTGFAGDVFVPEAGRAVHLRFHRDGFRGPDLPYQKAPGTVRVALLGDSMIAAVATDEEATLAARLEALLNGRRTGTGRFEVQNFGVSSASTGQELVTYRSIARRYQPDVVVLAFNAANDLADNCTCLSQAHRLYFDLDSGGRLVGHRSSPPLAGVGRWLDRHSRFYVWQKTAVAQLRSRWRESQQALEPWQEVFRSEETAAGTEAWAITGALVEALREETRADGATLVLALVPAPEQVYDDLWQDLLRRAGSSALGFARGNPERRLGMIARRLGIELVDLGVALRSAAPRASSQVEAERLFFAGRYHWNDAGNRVAAQALADAVRRRQPTDPARPR